MNGRTELAAGQLPDIALACGPGWFVELPVADGQPITGILQEAKSWGGGGAALVTVQIRRHDGALSTHILAGMDPVIVLGTPD